MARAIWNSAIIADSDQTIVIENNHYFPASAVHRQFLRDSDHHTTCGWKGEASYYDVVVNGQVNQNAAWYYPHTKDAAKNIEGYVAFWKGVTVQA
jgi:uncharacterized protein (DUF427 family)